MYWITDPKAKRVLHDCRVPSTAVSLFGADKEVTMMNVEAIHAPGVESLEAAVQRAGDPLELLRTSTTRPQIGATVTPAPCIQAVRDSYRTS